MKSISLSSWARDFNARELNGVVRYIGKGRNGRIYSHLIDAKRTAGRPGVKIRDPVSGIFGKR